MRDVGFNAPESVVYDPYADVYLVSNVAGGALEIDDRAFISRVRPDGSLEALKWIDSARPDVELHAPKGMAIVGDVLYVADVRYVRKFARADGRVLGAIALEDSSFLHDLAADERGAVFVSDTGLGAGFAAIGGDAVYRIASDGVVSVIARARSLGQPSGLWAAPEGLWVASFAAGELYLLTPSGVRTRRLSPPKGSLDGVAMLNGRLFVSSWEASAVYELGPRGFVERIANLKAPADLGVDRKRQRLLVTHYDENALSVHQL